jgi:hypothetical protein
VGLSHWRGDQFHAIEFARPAHVRWRRTFHHPRNAAAIAVNRRLGFIDDPEVTA